MRGTASKATINSDGSNIALIGVNSTDLPLILGLINTTDGSMKQYIHNDLYPPYADNLGNIDIKYSPNDGAIFFEASTYNSYFSTGYV